MGQQSQNFLDISGVVFIKTRYVFQTNVLFLQHWKFLLIIANKNSEE